MKSARMKIITWTKAKLINKQCRCEVYFSHPREDIAEENNRNTCSVDFGTLLRYTIYGHDSYCNRSCFTFFCLTYVSELMRYLFQFQLSLFSLEIFQVVVVSSQGATGSKIKWFFDENDYDAHCFHELM